MRSSYPFLDSDRPVAFAHRGGAEDGRENTMTAFARAVALGYRYLETDVHATADGVLVVFHDRDLARLTDRVGIIRNLPWREVRRARVRGREPVPLLEDVLGTWPDVRVNIDVKDVPAVGPLVEVIRRTNAVRRVCVGSFSDRRLAAVRAALGPTLATSLGPRAAARLVLASSPAPVGWLLTRLAPAGVPCAQVPPRLRGMPVITRRFLDAAHARGVVVHAWTVNDEAQMRRLLDLGVDGVMTDRLETLRDVLLERGQWPS